MSATDETKTTLGARTIAARLLSAASTHDVEIWSCGLASAELHIARVRLRVASGGHDISESMIRTRFSTTRHNLIELMPHLAFLRVYDNSAESDPGGAVPDPLLVMEMARGRLTLPAANDIRALGGVPDWAKPLLEAALQG